MLAKSSDTAKLFYLIVLSLVGSFILGVAVAIPELIAPWLHNDIRLLRISIVFQDILVMMLPAYLIFKWSYAKPIRQLGFVKQNNIGQLLFYALLLFFVSSPAISLTAQLNEQIVFPESLKKLEVWFKQMENAALETTNRLLSGTSYFTLLQNLIVIAAMAALSEEIFFRGALQRLLKGWLGNGHTAVWLAAFIFSAIHLQFYGFIPRLLMGAVMGYLFLFTGNIWVPIFYHFVNNASVLLSKFYLSENEWYERMENIDLNWASYMAMLLSLLVTFYLFKKIKRVSAKSVNIERPITEDYEEQ